MRITLLPKIKDYWNQIASHERMLKNEWIQQRMSRDRWKEIHSNITEDIFTFQII